VRKRYVLSSVGTTALAAALPAALRSASVVAEGERMSAVPNPIALGVYQPSFPDDLSGLAAYEGASGQRLTLLHWYALWGGWKSAFSRADLDAVAGRGAVPLITWEPWAGTGPAPSWSLRNAVLSGAYDGYVDSWARGLADYGGPVLLRFAHEMHHHPHYPWAVGVNGNTAADYVAAWRHIRGIFARYRTGNVRWVWNPNTLGGASAEAHLPVYRSLYPGDALVDWLGLDIFNTGPSLDWGAPYWRTFDQALRNPYAALTSVSSRSLLLPEVGCTETGGSKADWIAAALGPETGARFPRLRALVWFDVDKEQPWQLHSSDEALAAWREASAAPRAAFDAWAG
jgi:beta-mannanase